jgi:hypothetical protein
VLKFFYRFSDIGILNALELVLLVSFVDPQVFDVVHVLDDLRELLLLFLVIENEVDICEIFPIALL